MAPKQMRLEIEGQLHLLLTVYAAQNALRLSDAVIAILREKLEKPE